MLTSSDRLSAARLHPTTLDSHGAAREVNLMISMSYLSVLVGLQYETRPGASTYVHTKSTSITSDEPTSAVGMAVRGGGGGGAGVVVAETRCE